MFKYYCQQVEFLKGKILDLWAGENCWGATANFSVLWACKNWQGDQVNISGLSVYLRTVFLSFRGVNLPCLKGASRQAVCVITMALDCAYHNHDLPRLFPHWLDDRLCCPFQVQGQLWSAGCLVPPTSGLCLHQPVACFGKSAWNEVSRAQGWLWGETGTSLLEPKK